MLFTLEPGSNLEDFSNLLYMIRDRFCDDEIYAPLKEFWSDDAIEGYKQWLLIPLAHQLVADGTIAIVYEETFDTILTRLHQTVQDAADALRMGQPVSQPLLLWDGHDESAPPSFT